MCGIVGISSKLPITDAEWVQLKNASDRLQKRGPDNSGLKRFERLGLAHRRLSILDTTASANQPMTDLIGRYTIIFNGEIYNYKRIRSDLEKDGYSFSTTGDTEVLIHAYDRYGTAFLNKLNGFFALAIYDQVEGSLLIARDRFGIKPLLISISEDRIVFASEMKALLEFDIAREIDHSSLYTYLQLNYIPEPHSIFKDVKKVEPGHYLIINDQNKIQKIPFYQSNYSGDIDYQSVPSYEEAQETFISLLEDSVQQRLVSDVPLGTFLSGGIDSSLITTLASRHVKNLNTFSIGFKDNPHFDETEYALLVAKKCKTNHHVFSLTNDDLFQSLEHTLNYIDEPFADSSALAVNALSNETAKHVKVALSGDGADELFAGYNKHRGEFYSRQKGIKRFLIEKMKPILESMPKSRDSKLTNLFRKLHRFSEGSSLSQSERYWLWASLMNEADAANLMLKKAKPDVYLKRKNQHLSILANSTDFNDVLFTDVKLVLLGDMLRKVDLMSMANSLEVRTPFLDHRLVDFAFTLPSQYKIDSKMTKRIVQDASKNILPAELYNRPKKGFEVPLLNWFNRELKSLIFDDLLSESFIKNQNLFNLSYVNNLKDQLTSINPKEAQGNIWALLVFNSWWKRYIG